MHYHCSKLCTVYKRDIIHVVVWSRVSCTTTVQNYALSTSATLYMWFFWSRVSCTTTVQNYTVCKRDIIQVVVWSRVSCTTTVQNYTLSTSATLYRWLFGAVLVALPLFKIYTVYKRDIAQVVDWSGVSCTATFLNYTLSTSATLYRWLFGAVLVALPLFKTVHCLQA